MKTIVKSAIAFAVCCLILNNSVLAEPLEYGSKMLSCVVSSAVRFEKEVVPNNNYVEGCRYAKPIPDIDIYDTETDPFFENSVFIGDSIMEGFRNYCQNKGGDFLSKPLFIAARSLSIRQLLQPVSETSRHPSYQGVKMSVEDVIVKSGAEKAFLMFGTNDMVGLSPDETLKEYNDLIYRIHKAAPDVKIYIIGSTYIYTSGQKPGFTNENLRKLNDSLYTYCGNYDYLEFINIGDRLIGSDDGVKAEYSSDKYVHMTGAAYDVWVKVLRAYAKDFISEEE